MPDQPLRPPTLSTKPDNRKTSTHSIICSTSSASVSDRTVLRVRLASWSRPNDRSYAQFTAVTLGLQRKVTLLLPSELTTILELITGMPLFRHWSCAFLESTSNSWSLR